MHTIRRVYAYFISGVSLGMLTASIVLLIGLLLDQWLLAAGITSVMRDEPGALRTQLSIALGLLVPALPIWLVHWLLTQRGLRPERSDAENERRSTVRALYLALVLGLSLLTAATSAAEALVGGLMRLFGATDLATWSNIANAMARALIVGGVWLYHARVLRNNREAGALAGAADWWPRLYVYCALYVGALALMFGVTGLLSLISDVLLAGPIARQTTAWWAEPLAGGLGAVIVGGLVWLGHWRVGLASLALADWRGAAEQHSVLRRVYLYLVIMTGVGMTMVALRASLESVLKTVFGASEFTAFGPWLRSVVEPPLGVLPFAAFWFLHARTVRAEADAFADTTLQASVRRLYTYLVAAVGLLATAVGLAMLIGVTLDHLLSGSGLSMPPNWWQRQAASSLALAAVGAVLWLWQWYAAQRRLAAQDAAERPAFTRRLYLFAIVAVALVAVLVSVAVVFYQVLTAILSVRSWVSIIPDASYAAGTVLVALPIFLYHGLAVRRDLAATRQATPSSARLRLELVGPPGTDLTAVADGLRDHLPAGYRLEARDSGRRAAEPPRADEGHATPAAADREHLGAAG